MTVKIIADSLGDVPEELVKKLDITIIPINVLFGMETYRDGVDISTAQFYDKLVRTKALPTTAVPALGIFADIYDRVAQDTDEILALTVSHKLSGTFDAATHAVEMMKRKCRVKVIDTLHVIMGEGLVVIAAAQAAKKGASFEELEKLIRKNIERSEERMAFDTLDYLKRGGRIGAGQAFLGSLLKINPVLGIKDGEIHPITRERSRAKALDALYNFALGFSHIEALAVEDATTPDEGNALTQRITEKFPGVHLYRSIVSPVIGAHVGPSVVAVTVLGDH
jgi:DegV family protein with EDD domain